MSSDEVTWESTWRKSTGPKSTLTDTNFQGLSTLERDRGGISRFMSRTKISQKEGRGRVKENHINRDYSQEESRKPGRERVHWISNCGGPVELGKMAGVDMGRVWIEECVEAEEL